MTLVFPPKKPAENRAWGFDLNAELAENETISGTPTVTIAPLLPDLDDPVGTTLEAVGSPVVDGSVVTQRLRKGTPGQTYLVTATVVTSGGNTIEVDAEISIVGRSPS
jgi:hypothetical protein